jgi:outer membrane lipoprotein-sorting protein
LEDEEQEATMTQDPQPVASSGRRLPGQHRRWLPWTAPAAVAVCIIAGAVAPRAFAANPHPRLPVRTATQLIAALETSNVQSLSGTVHTDAHLGLPSLPDSFAGGGNGLTALLSGTNTVRVWVRGAHQQRLALLGTGSEMDVIHNGRDLWTWNSATQSVMHMVTPSADATADPPATPADQLTPAQQAREALRAIDPSTSVAVSRTARVAGRPAYTLTLTPKTPATLVGKVQIAVDAATSVPLGVWIYGRGSSTPAFSTSFTAVSFATPASSNFAFTPPDGATVTQKRAPSADKHGANSHSATKDRNGATLLGTGWTSVLELPQGGLGDTSATNPGHDNGSSAGSALNEITTPVAQGRLLTTRLLSVLIANDGRILIGAVPGTTLQTLAGSAGR